MSNIVRGDLHSLDETFNILEHVLLGAVTVHVLHYALVLADDRVDILMVHGQAVGRLLFGVVTADVKKRMCETQRDRK